MTSSTERTVDREEYDSYIKSTAWRKKRDKFFDSTEDHSCFVCHDRDSVKHLHHRTYRNLGNEKITDLVIVCKPCHQGIHDLHKQSELSLWDATAKLRELYQEHGSIRVPDDLYSRKKKKKAPAPPVSLKKLKNDLDDINTTRKKRAVRRLRARNKKRKLREAETVDS